MDGYGCAWLKLEAVSGLANESVRGTQIPHREVNIDRDDDIVWGRGVQWSPMHCVCISIMFA